MCFRIKKIYYLKKCLNCEMHKNLIDICCFGHFWKWKMILKAWKHGNCIYLLFNQLDLIMFKNYIYFWGYMT